MRTIHLHGNIGKTFGRSHQFAVDTVPEAIQALRANFAGFANHIREGFYRVVVGKTEKNGLELGEEDLPGFKLGKQDLHIVPVLKGSKRGGIGKVIAGIALIGLSAFGGAALAAPLFAGGTMSTASVIGSLGTGLLLTGVASLIAPQQETEKEDPNYSSSGPVTTTREGGIVPIAYGEVVCGGTMINGILTTKVGPKGKQKTTLDVKTLFAPFTNKATDEQKTTETSGNNGLPPIFFQSDH
ncbi:tail assembly protein [Paenirhodobacter hankyongi]|uniref:Tail assembly protein n=1 Tax=Paenirhodobacter hankyongi TaxID=2294033 RepID=A0A421BN12_9RHOB|nr:tail assembly protein [Sinirhodobacter hankyongi]RLL64297.1 tail assembly protein [Sinirhodobacter hankyongi]